MKNIQNRRPRLKARHRRASLRRTKGKSRLASSRGAPEFASGDRFQEFAAGLHWLHVLGDERHADAGTQQLQGDFLAIGEFDAVAISAVLETREDHFFHVFHTESGLQIARYIL